MPGPRFDWGAFLEKGGQFAYDYLSEQQKHKRKMQGLVDEEKRKQEERERDRENTRKEFGMGIIEKVVTGEFNPHTKQKFVQWGIEQEWIDPGILGLGVTPPPPMSTLEGMGQAPVTRLTTMPGGTAGVEDLYTGGYTPPGIGEVPRMYEPSAVAEEEGGELFGKAEEEKTYKEKVRKWIEKNPNKPYPGLSMGQTHKVLGAYIAPEKGPTVAERKLGMDAVSVASLIRQGVKTEKTTFGEQRFALTSKGEAINFAGEMGWTADTPEYQQHIAPAVEEWWGTYRPGEIKKLQLDKAVRRKAFKALKKAKKIGLIRELVPVGNKEVVDDFIAENWQMMDKSLEEILREIR